jgi:fibronectin type 3 domain-containing protein
MRRRIIKSRFVLISIALLPTLTVFPHPVQAQVQFTEVTTIAGIGQDFYGSSNSHSLGVNWIDYDSDGWPDLFLVNGYNQKAHLYQNNGDGTFTNKDSLLPPLPNVEMGGSVFADYDNDGDPDLYIYTENDDGQSSLVAPPKPWGPPNLLLKNLWVENGNQILPDQPLFLDVAVQAGVQDDFPEMGYPGLRAMTAGWLDYDRDGCLDLYVGHWVVSLNLDSDPANDIANRDRLYRNRCDGTFEDVTASSGLNPGTDPLTYRPALGFIGAHLDNDLWPDLYVVNNAVLEPRVYHYDFLFRNNGDGTFTDVTSQSPGIGNDAQAGMGIDVADLELDGDWDIYISDIYETTLDDPPLGNVLYLNNGDGTLQDNSAPQAGVAGDFSWGVNFFDADQDGYENLYVATNSGKPKFLYRNNHNGTFTDVGTAAGINTTVRNSRGSAVADYDHDGDLDLAVVNKDSPLQLFRNDTVNPGHWLQLKLIGVLSNRSSVGALIKVKADGLNMMRQVKGGSSAHSQDDLTVHFGLGPANTADEIKILWPSGLTTLLMNQPADQRLVINEGCSTGLTDTTPPTAPTHLTIVTTGSNKIELAWAESTDDLCLSGYRVYRGGVLIANPSATTYWDIGLSPSTQYCYTITAVDATDNESDPSDEICATTKPVGAPPSGGGSTPMEDTPPLSAPTNLTAEVIEGLQIQLAWRVPGAEVVEYTIYRGGIKAGTSASPTYIDAGLDSNTTYCYRVTARDAASNESEPSNEACEKPFDFTLPDPPADLTAASVTAASVELTWTAAGDDVGVVNYRVYRGAEPVGEPVETAFTDTSVSPDKTYLYTVTALDAAGHESYTSNAVEVRTPAKPAPNAGCFIATAAFGSSLSSRVQLLREFRDRFLLSFDLGRWMVRLYERYSPPLARLIAQDEGLRFVVRTLLWSLIGLAWLFVQASIELKLGMLIGFGMVIGVIRRHEQNQRTEF